MTPPTVASTGHDSRVLAASLHDGLCDGSACWVYPEPTGLRLNALSGSWDLVVAVGETGVAVTWNGAELRLEHAARGTELVDVWVSAGGLAYAVGENGMVMRTSDGTWRPSACRQRVLRAVDGVGEVVAAAGAAGSLAVLSGESCRTIPTGVADDFIDVFALDADTFVAVSANRVVRAAGGVVTAVYTAEELGVGGFRFVAGLGPEAFWIATTEGAVLDGANGWRRDDAACPATRLWSASQGDDERLVVSGGGCVADGNGWRTVASARRATGGMPLGSEGDWLVLTSDHLELRAGADLEEGVDVADGPAVSPSWTVASAAAGSIWLSGPGLHVFADGHWSYAEIEEPPLSSQELLAGLTGLVARPDGTVLATASLGPRGEGALLRVTREGLVTEHVDLESSPSGLAIGADVVIVGPDGGHVVADGSGRAIFGTGRAELIDVCASEDGAWLVGADGAVFYLAAGATRARRIASDVTERLVDCASDDSGSAWVVGIAGALLRCSNARCDQMDRAENSLVAALVLDGQPWVFGGTYAAEVTAEGLREADIGIGDHRIVDATGGPDAGWLVLSPSGLVRIAVDDR